jgi:polar amino acid transport system substrate-binding protein
LGLVPERAKEWDFTTLHLEIEFGYLIPSGSSISTMADVDRPGTRVAVQEKSQPAVFLSRTLKNAVVVRASSLTGTLELLKSGESGYDLQHQAKLVRGVESIARFSCS